uniref:Elongation of very long chain fatty acids protein n=1 Tax=Timema cristinae TaxID=61476 RepID=A0A7R9H9B4_TIMCR|nr:unnamed protein product [Timema cristinae]
MATGISAVVDGYKTFMETKSDPRTADWFLMSSPMPLLIILISYLYFVNKAGPRYMKDRKPYDLRNLMLAYNALQIVFSVYLVYEKLDWLLNLLGTLGCAFTRVQEWPRLAIDNKMAAGCAGSIPSVKHSMIRRTTL